METEINKKKDVWCEGVRSIMAATKRSLLDYIDAVSLNAEFTKEKQQLEKVKMRVHNDISQASFNVGVLLSAFKSGGDISAFEDDLNKKENKKLRVKEKVEEVEIIQKKEVVVEKIGDVLIESNASTDQENNSN